MGEIVDFPESGQGGVLTRMTILQFFIALSEDNAWPVIFTGEREGGLLFLSGFYHYNKNADAFYLYMESEGGFTLMGGEPEEECAGEVGVLPEMAMWACLILELQYGVKFTQRNAVEKDLGIFDVGL